MSKGPWTSQGNTESTYLDSLGLTETELPTRELAGANLGPLYICCRFVAWSSCGTPDKRSGSLLLCYLLLEPFPPTVLLHPALIGEDVPSPGATLIVHVYTWKAYTFLKEWERE